MAYLYRHKKNRKLYKLYRVSPRMVTGRHVEAEPYNHKDYITKRCNNKQTNPHVNVEDFIAVAYI